MTPDTQPTNLLHRGVQIPLPWDSLVRTNAWVGLRPLPPQFQFIHMQDSLLAPPIITPDNICHIIYFLFDDSHMTAASDPFGTLVGVQAKIQDVHLIALFKIMHSYFLVVPILHPIRGDP